MGLRNYLATARPTILNGDIAIGADSFTMQDGTGYPTANFIVTFERDGVKEEKVLVGARSGNSCTGVERGFDGTVPIDHSSGVPIEHTDSALDFSEANRHKWDPAQAEIDHSTLLNATRHAAIPHSTAMLADGVVTTPKLGDGQVTPAKLSGALPKGVLLYTEIPGPHTGFAAELPVSPATYAVTVGSGRRLKIAVELFVRQQTSNALVGLWIKEGATYLGAGREGVNISITGFQTMRAVAIVSPTAGLHTYIITLGTSSGSVDVQAIGSSASRNFVLIEDIGAA